MNILDIFVRGGVMMWPVLACTILSVGLIIERAIALRRVESQPEKFLAMVRTLALRRDMKGLIACCSERRSGLAHVLREGASRFGQGEYTVRDAMQSAYDSECRSLGRRLPGLAVATTCTPMIGILGALLGIITAMRGVETHATSAQHLLAGHLWSSLVPAAFGLAAWLPLFAAYSYCAARARRAANETESAMMELERWLKEPVSEESVHHATGPPAHQTRRAAPHDEDEYFRRKSEVSGR